MPITAQDNEKIRYEHRTLSRIELNNSVSTQMIECHVDHPYCAIYDFGSSSNDRSGLLTLEHRGSNFRCVGQVADSSLQDGDARIGQPFLYILA